jgi:biopolymer transport protein ExbB
MNKQLLKICGGIALLASVSLSTLVQAQDLNAVLEQTRAVREAANALAATRAAEFNAMSDADKQRVTREAAASRAAIQPQVDAKTKQYADNDLQINQLNNQLREKANQLGVTEVFGLARQYAGDSATKLEQSLINAQFSDDAPNRVAFMQELAASERILTAAQLERLWFELQREMTASGQVASYSGTVVEPNGSSRTTNIIRIGSFIATADGQYLAYTPELGRLSVLSKQLDPEFMSAAAQLQQATSGYVSAVVDSTRGVLLGMVVERQTWIARFEEGELIVHVTLAIGLLGSVAFIFQVIYLVLARLGVSAQVRNLQNPSKSNALGRVLLAFNAGAGSIEDNSEVAELRLSEAVMREVPKMERFQPLLRLVVAAGPLLGLVGTVMGMIITFQSITEAGSSDPKLMADGIGQAMIATLAGLGIAVPMLFANALLNSLSRSIVQILDEQSAGILASNIEKRKNG